MSIYSPSRLFPKSRSFYLQIIFQSVALCFVLSLYLSGLCCAAVSWFRFSPYQFLCDGFSTDSRNQGELGCIHLSALDFQTDASLVFLCWFFFLSQRALIVIKLTAEILELLVLSVNFSVLSASSDNIIAEVMFAFSLHFILIENKTNAFLSHFSTSLKSR